MPTMNLWDEFDNSEPAPEFVRYKQTRHRLTEQSILSSLRELLLPEYLASYCRSLTATRIYRRCYLIDALGAKAPLQSLTSLSQQLSQESRPITLQSMILEAGSSKRKQVRISQNGASSPAKHLTLPKESGFVHTSWLEAATSLLTTIDQSPAIFLLNPFGQTTFGYDDLAPLYFRTAPTELCLLTSHKQVEAGLMQALSTADGAANLTGLLRSDRWKALISDGGGKGIIDLLAASMQPHFLSVQCIAFPMVVGPAIVEDAPYTLLFATRRQDSLISMNDAVCLYRRRLYELSLRGALVEDWFIKQQEERFGKEIEQLYERMLFQGRAQRVRRWPDLRQQLLIAHFGQFTQQNYDEVMSRLLVKGEVYCEWRRGLPEKLENAIPGNEDLLRWK